MSDKQGYFRLVVHKQPDPCWSACQLFHGPSGNEELVELEHLVFYERRMMPTERKRAVKETLRAVSKPKY